MNNFNSISRGFNDLLQDEWIKGHPDTSREICRTLNTQKPEVIAQSYTRGFHDSLCTQGVLFWKTISNYINSFVAGYNTAQQYLARDSYYPATHNAALCLKYTSLGYLMDLVYCGLLENHITQQHIQQMRDVTSDEKGLGLQIAGIDVEDYNELLKSTTPKHTSTSTKADAEIMKIPEAKILLDRLVESEILNSDYSLGTTHLSTAAVIADAISRTCNITKKNVLFSSLWNVSAEQLRDGLQSAKRAVDKSKYREVLSRMFVKENSFGSYQTDHTMVDEMMRNI